MKNVSVLIFVSVIAVVVMLFLVSFQVRETEVALVTTFGQPTKSIEEPGWRWKWPVPIQRVYKFDSRNQIYHGIMEETTTKGGDPINLTSYVIWTIAEPQKFLESVHDKAGAERQMRSMLRDTQNSVVGRYYFSDFVNSDPAKIKFAAIENEMLGVLSQKARGAYGIEVKLVGIRQLGVSTDVSKNVFERMKADRQRRTNETLAQGEAEAMKIKADAEAKKTELLAIVEAKAKEIRGEGDAEAAKYYKLLEADPEFAMFLRDIEALKKILEQRSTIVLGAETDPIKLLREIPDIEPKK